MEVISPSEREIIYDRTRSQSSAWRAYPAWRAFPYVFVLFGYNFRHKNQYLDSYLYVQYVLQYFDWANSYILSLFWRNFDNLKGRRHLQGKNIFFQDKLFNDLFKWRVHDVQGVVQSALAIYILVYLWCTRGCTVCISDLYSCISLMITHCSLVGSKWFYKYFCIFKICNFSKFIKSCQFFVLLQIAPRPHPYEERNAVEIGFMINKK